MWKMRRPHTLTATFSPVILGTVASLYVAEINWLLFIAMMLACLALQIATNLFKEYYDFKRGLDTADSFGIGGEIVRHGGIFILESPLFIGKYFKLSGTVTVLQ